MSLSSSLFTGTSGLTNMGNAMQVVGNNISNVNTVGFKKGRSVFADTLSQNIATLAGTSQVGRGMTMGTVDQNFDQGSFESTGNTTDLSIGGDGFFVLRQNGTDNNFYSRAGNFHFDNAGQLVNPEGYIVQGWELDDETGEDVGSIRDVVLEAFTSPPKKSSQVTMIANLDADADSQSVVLSNNWDSSEETIIDGKSYEYQSVVKVYDALGSTHDVTVYYDKKTGTDWEYIVTCNPEEDNRNLVGETDSKGLLARGTITFSQSSGDILDFTMSEFTGRIGNVQANGVNTVEAVNFQITDYEKMPLDGYGFVFEFDGSTWNFQDKNSDGFITGVDKPANYANAVIVYSDDQNIHIALDPDDPSDVEPDLKIKLDQPAVATDSLGFDINNKNDLHVQGIEGTTYTGDTANDNTSLEINNPDVMTHDVSGIGIAWNPVSERWYWSNPSVVGAGSAQTLVSGVDVAGLTTASSLVSSTPLFAADMSAMNLVSDDIKVRFDGTRWDWNLPLKDDDFVNETFDFTPKNDPVLGIVSAGAQGAMPSTAGTPIELHWLGSEWSTSTAAAAVTSSAFGTTRVAINTGASDDTQVELTIWDGAGNSAGGSVIRYSFGSQLTTAGGDSLEFELDPSPPEEYPNAVITSAGGSTFDLAIDFNGDLATDLTFDMVSAGASAIAAGNTFVFDVNPDGPPAEYANATLTGDKTEAVIDLDGSGNEGDKRDIVFKFADSLSNGPSTDPYLDRSIISFDIKGSTAWTTIEKDDIKTTGYYAFTTDFLGGEFGSTETDIEFNIGTKFDGNNFINDSLSTTQYARSSTTTFQDGDGYAAGDLQGVDVSSDGTMTGIYSNGQLIPLFRVGLADFRNNQGLSTEGGNLFRETRASGEAITNKPGENGLGTISPNSLEMSNVDISEEFVKMITTQRGFQANSKTITTVDGMMETVINMKR